LGTAVIVWLLLLQIRLADIWGLLVRVDVKWLLAGLGWYLLTNVLRSYRFGTLMSITSIRQPLRLLPEMIALSFLNNVLPARSGELSFPYLMQRRHGTPIGDSLTYLLIVRIFDLVAMSTLFVVFASLETGKLTPVAGQAVTGVMLLLLPVFLVLACLTWLGKRGLQGTEWVLGRLSLLEHKGGQWTLGVGQRAVGAMSQVHHVSTYGRVFFWSLLGWLTTFAWFAAFLQAIHVPVRYPLVIVGATLATLSKAIPLVTVGGLGAHEAGWALGFRLVGMPLTTAIASGFAVNILTLLASLVFALSALLYEKSPWRRRISPSA
jgi:uncharacterized protein (TIRG00374 family)